jgi:prepilin-type N-terminal cleavage/methylation domain-containing protein
MRPRRAVTLVELLVVITIIGLLIGLLLLRVLKAGYELAWHWSEGVASAAIETTDFDFVVLQERSEKPCQDAAAYQESMLQFGRLARERGAIPVGYMLWERKNNSGFCPLSSIASTCERAIREIQQGDGLADVAPAGPAWKAMLDAQPDAPLHSDDGNHSAPAGAYLAACVFHAVIHEESPVGLPASLTPAPIVPNPEGLPDAGTVSVPASDAALMQEIAWKTAGEWRRKTQA